MQTRLKPPIWLSVAPYDERHLMKKCTYCGKEYPGAVTVCPIDGQPLPKTDQELLAMFDSPADYLPEMLNQAAEELNRRNIDTSHLWTIVRREPDKTGYCRLGRKFGIITGIAACAIFDFLDLAGFIPPLWHDTSNFQFTPSEQVTNLLIRNLVAVLFFGIVGHISGDTYATIKSEKKRKPAMLYCVLGLAILIMIAYGISLHFNK